MLPPTEEQINLHKLGQEYLKQFRSVENTIEVSEHFKLMVFVVINILSESKNLTNNR
jgi:hypothetical protein